MYYEDRTENSIVKVQLFIINKLNINIIIILWDKRRKKLYKKDKFNKSKNSTIWKKNKNKKLKI